MQQVDRGKCRSCIQMKVALTRIDKLAKPEDSSSKGGRNWQEIVPVLNPYVNAICVSYLV